ncbi:Ff.00g035070.m01.CDS01 [Fusarium sp. VM40]|nr:Ff.00g035070.m01.CDS01 [Fusarium sp. VM40]
MPDTKNQFEGTPTVRRYPPSGINILVAGAGLGGLSFAIEAHRKGHDVCVIDRRPHFNDYGDFIALQGSALKTPKSWPGFLEACQREKIPQVGKMCTHDGQFIGNVTFGLSTLRSSLHRLLYHYAMHLGIEIRLSARVVDYFEGPDKGGVVLEDGSELTADLVVAADGVGSRSGGLIKGERDQPTSSGFAMIRATYPAERVSQNPHLQEFLEDRSSAKGVVGAGAHVITGCSGDNVSWMLTHKDNDPNGNERAPTVDPRVALKYVQGWVPWLNELIKNTPDMGAVDYKLLWRDPSPTWASKHARVVQIGDAAHAFLPTSAAGATMAMEDGFSLATCLQLGGKSNVALAVKIHNELRFKRVTCAQKTGFKNRQLYHESTFKPAEEGTCPVFPMTSSWIYQHDPEQYAYEMYGKCANHLLSDSPFDNTNYPPGHQFKTWTVKEMREVAERGENIIDDGDWS